MHLAFTEIHGDMDFQKLDASHQRGFATLLMQQRLLHLPVRKPLENKEDKDLIFRSGPYFMGPRGLYLNRWTLSFDP